MRVVYLGHQVHLRYFTASKYLFYVAHGRGAPPNDVRLRTRVAALFIAHVMPLCRRASPAWPLQACWRQRYASQPFSLLRTIAGLLVTTWPLRPFATVGLAKMHVIALLADSHSTRASPSFFLWMYVLVAPLRVAGVCFAGLLLSGLPLCISALAPLFMVHACSSYPNYPERKMLSS
jgi:hypothetical protein